MVKHEKHEELDSQHFINRHMNVRKLLFKLFNIEGGLCVLNVLCRDMFLREDYISKNGFIKKCSGDNFKTEIISTLYIANTSHYSLEYTAILELIRGRPYLGTVMQNYNATFNIFN